MNNSSLKDWYTRDTRYVPDMQFEKRCARSDRAQNIILKNSRARIHMRIYTYTHIVPTNNSISIAKNSVLCEKNKSKNL